MSRLQLDATRGAWVLSLLVRQGRRPETHRWSSSPHVRTDVFEASGHMSAPMPPDVSRGAMPAMHTYGSDPDLLLREEYVHKAVH